MGSTVFSGQYGHHMTLEMLSGIVSQDPSKNQSKIRVWTVLKTDRYGGVYGITAPQTVHIGGGGAIHNVSINIQPNSTVTLWQSEYVITHDPDGTKTIRLSAKLDINIGGYGSAEVSQDMVLTPIKRASGASVSEAVIGSPMLITLDAASADYTYNLRYDWYSKSGIIASNIENSYNWTIPKDFADNLPDSTSGLGTIYIDTYYDGKKIGEKSVRFTAKIQDNIKPILTGITITDGNRAVKQNVGQGNYLQTLSNLSVSFSASGSYGSKIVGYHAEIVGKNQSTDANGGTLGPMSWSGSAVIRATVTDSRGQVSDSKDYPITVLEYHAPILSFDVTRGGALNNILAVNRNAKIAPLFVNGRQRNTMTLTFKVALANTETYTADNGSASGTWTSVAQLTNSLANLGGFYLSNKSYDLIGILSDKFTKTEFKYTVTTEKVVVSYDQNGVGVNKIRERGAVDVLGDVYIDGELYLNSKRLIDVFYPVGVIYESTSSTSPATIMGGTWERFGNGKVTVGVSENEVEFNTVNKSGGEKVHTLTIDEIPAHSHRYTTSNIQNYVKVEASSTYGRSADKTAQTSSVGGGRAHNNLQPYVTVYRWRRIA